jgi:hypothetical protein
MTINFCFLCYFILIAFISFAIFFASISLIKQAYAQKNKNKKEAIFQCEK